MISPHIHRAVEEMKNARYADIFTKERGPAVSINSITTKAGSFYEKLRYMVDYKEEHTIRRSAIERIIKRAITIEVGRASRDVGTLLLQELVGARYLPNNQVSESVAIDIQQIVNKYLQLFKSRAVEKKLAISLAATEIDHFLFPQKFDEAIVDAFYNTIAPHISYDAKVDGNSFHTQVYIACRQSLLADDSEMLLCALVHKALPSLSEIIDDERAIQEMAMYLPQVIAATEHELEKSLSFRISSKLRNHAIEFRVIREIFNKHKGDVGILLEDDERIEYEIRSLLTARYKQQKSDLSRSGLRAVSYILLTKIFIAFLIEYPYEKYIVGTIDYFALGTNVVFHPLLLFLIIKTSRHPDEKNTQLITQGVYKILHERDIQPIYIKENTYGTVTKGIFIALYSALYIFSFGGILYVLNELHFNIASIALFLFFVTVVSYFGFRLRYNAQKWMVTRGEDGIMMLLWDLMTFPIVRTGRWLSLRFSSVNVFVFVLDFIIETPFKFILGTFDSFVHYLRDRKEDPL